MRRIVDGKKYTIPSTIDDPTILKEIEKAIKMIQQNKNTQEFECDRKEGNSVFVTPIVSPLAERYLFFETPSCIFP
jgi:hypothetical protein